MSNIKIILAAIFVLLGLVLWYICGSRAGHKHDSRRGVRSVWRVRAGCKRYGHEY